MKQLLLFAWAPLLLGPAGAAAQTLSQARLEDDCLQRLRPIIPREVKAEGVDFSALGSNATYYVVSYRFSGDLGNGRRSAACTYLREGRWVRDDAAAYKFLRELEAAPRRGKPD